MHLHHWRLRGVCVSWILGLAAQLQRRSLLVTHGLHLLRLVVCGLVLSDACLADCIDELGEHADHPSSEELREVLPKMIERHGLGITRLMLATTVAGEAPAAAIIRDLLKHDETVKLPPAETRAAGPVARAPRVDSAEREAIKAKRKELKKQKQEAARARREQSERDRGR